MTTVQSLPSLRPPRADALYRTIERWIDAAIHAALSNTALTQRQHVRAQVVLQRWRQRAMLEVSAISDERGLVDLLSQVDQLTAQISGQIAAGTPLISVSPPAEQLRDELMSAYSEEAERLTTVSEELEVSNALLHADVAGKRRLWAECEREIAATVELVHQARLLTLGLNEAQTSDE